MKLSRLLEIHRHSLRPQDLADNLGDGVLARDSRIYAKIREATLRAGYRFSHESNAGYQALPFAQLENILETKVIPYVNNVSVLERLVAQLKDGVVWDDISDGLKTNFIFHESCHAVARSFKISQAVSDQRSKCLRMLMEESFANTCELLAVSDADDPAHRIFFRQNSYTALFEEKTHIKSAIASCGFETVFKVMWLAYLHSNYLFDQLDEKAWHRCLALAGAQSLPAAQIKMLKSLSRIAFTLDPRFRLVTTRFHLKLNGVSMKLEDALDFDFLSDRSLHEFADFACRVLA